MCGKNRLITLNINNVLPISIPATKHVRPTYKDFSDFAKYNKFCTH